jgi:hypothetical protein
VADRMIASKSGARTAVDFGTVAPAFGHAGGGVESYFANAVSNAKVPPTPVTTLPDV